ncbi:inositol hexakisphosphate kinase 2-like isoform X1 [Lampetra fluviatilis]
MSPILSEMDNYNINKGGVLLEPFVHQVGGHTCVLRFNDATICKPLIKREHQVYESLPLDIAGFVPQYKGIVSVSFEEDEEGKTSLIAYPQTEGEEAAGGRYERKYSLECGQPKRKQPRWDNNNCNGGGAVPSPSGNSEQQPHTDAGKQKSSSVEKRRQEKSCEVGVKSEVAYYKRDSSSENLPAETRGNPWSMECHQQQLQRMKDNSKHKNQYTLEGFLLLENLVSAYKWPCILDLKMGTRQHGDDASEEKQARQTHKCQQSTSAVLGVRVCGMQVYRVDAAQHMFMNKYIGRKLSVNGFKETLTQFFHNGQRLRKDLLEPVLRKLSELRVALERQDSYRFYSSSLLIIYEGQECWTSNSEANDSAGEEPGCDGAGVDEAVKVDVRMIDFAHTTCQQFTDDSVAYEGPDSDYIFGLRNLIHILKQIKHEHENVGPSSSVHEEESGD